MHSKRGKEQLSKNEILLIIYLYEQPILIRLPISAKNDIQNCLMSKPNFWPNFNLVLGTDWFSEKFQRREEGAYSIQKLILQIMELYRARVFRKQMQYGFPKNEGGGVKDKIMTIDHFELFQDATCPRWPGFVLMSEVDQSIQVVAFFPGVQEFKSVHKRNLRGCNCWSRVNLELIARRRDEGKGIELF